MNPLRTITAFFTAIVESNRNYKKTKASLERIDKQDGAISKRYAIPFHIFPARVEVEKVYEVNTDPYKHNYSILRKDSNIIYLKGKGFTFNPFTNEWVYNYDGMYLKVDDEQLALLELSEVIERFYKWLRSATPMSEENARKVSEYGKEEN